MSMLRFYTTIVMTTALVCGCAAQGTMKAEPSARDKQVVSDFQKRVNDYERLRKKTAGNPPAPSPSPDKVVQAQKDRSNKVRSARVGAKQGDIFAPPIAEYFKHQIAATLSGKQGETVRASLKNSEPLHGITVKINEPYPEGVPLQSTPPSLLLNLPILPKGLEYRVVNDDLVLHDIDTNLIVDFVPHAIAAP